MIAGGIEFDRVFLDRYNPARDRPEFEQAWQELATTSGQRREAYVPNYEGSSVVFGPADGVSGIRGEHSYAARPGHHLAPQSLIGGANTYEALGHGFTLLALGANDAEVARFEDTAGSLGIPLATVRGALEDGLAGYGSGLVLVRPDQHVAWAGDAAPEDTASVVRRAIGAGDL
jgi:hypothetical protein